MIKNKKEKNYIKSFFFILLFGIIFGIIYSSNFVSSHVWATNSTINASIFSDPATYLYFETWDAPTVFNISGQWYLIAGANYGNFVAFTWNGTGWQWNEGAQIGSVGDGAKASIFKMGSKYHLISGLFDGNFKGYTWDGDSWISNSTMNTGLPNIGGYSSPTVFQMGTQWHLIAGESTGNFKGFTWNGTAWKTNVTINASLPDIGLISAPTVFNTSLTRFNLISGANDGKFKGFTWNGTAWNKNTTINASLPDIGSISIPSVFQMGTQWHMISGNLDGKFKGFTFTEDSVAPKISMVSPSNNSNLTNAGIDIKYKYTEPYCANVTWNDNSGANTTLASCGTNITIPTWAEGRHNITIFMRDTSNNLNKTYTSFIIDSMAPKITSPGNQAGVEEDAPLTADFDATDAHFQSWSTNMFFITSDGLLIETDPPVLAWHIATGVYYVNVTADDTFGNINSSIIRIDSNTSPAISITSPSNNANTSNSGLDIIFNYGEYSCAETKWNDDNGANTILASCGTSITAPTWGQGRHNITVILTDISGDTGEAYVSFFVDSIYPKIAYDTETAANYANLSQHSIYVNVTLTETNFHNITYTLRNKTAILNTTTFTTAIKYLNFTKGIRDDNYTYFVNVTDTLGNKNSTAIRNLLLDATTPNVTISNINETEISATTSYLVLYTISDTYIKSCYFTLRNSSGDVHNYAENTSINCSESGKQISSLYYGTFTLQLWAEDYTGNIGGTSTTWTSIDNSVAGGSGGGGTVFILVNRTILENRTFCGDLICQYEGNDFGIKEDFWTCQQDCPGAVGKNIDTFFYYLINYCFDKDPDTLCFWTQGLSSVAIQERIKDEEESNLSVCGDGICSSVDESIFNCQKDCGKISIKTLVGDCFDKDKATACFWSGKVGMNIFFFVGGAFILSYFIKIEDKKTKKKVNTYKYIALKLKGVSKRRNG
jgi:hypothetical protein